MMVKKAGAASPAQYAAPHDGLYDTLRGLTPVAVEAIVNKGTSKSPHWLVTIRFKTDSVYGYTKGTSVDVSPDWVYPIEAVKLTDEYGNFELSPYHWVTNE